MKIKFFAVFILFALGITTTHTIAGDAVIPRDDFFIIEPGQSLVIYGVRNHSCKKSAPSFKWAKRAVTTRPKNGSLSDGGTGPRESRQCGSIIARAITYTPNAGFTGDEVIVFYDKETVLVRVRN